MTTTEKIKHFIFYDDPIQFTKTMWRMTGGDRKATFDLIKDLATKHYNFDPTDEEIDLALAEIAGDGCEIEWLS